MFTSVLVYIEGLVWFNPRIKMKFHQLLYATYTHEQKKQQLPLQVVDAVDFLSAIQIDF